jgi:hypothetical protein
MYCRAQIYHHLTLSAFEFKTHASVMRVDIIFGAKSRVVLFYIYSRDGIAVGLSGEDL